MADRKTQTRPALTREAIVETALAVGDRDGIDAISLRGIANELGVTPMALYRYVESKELLLEAVAELTYSEVELPDPAQSDWWAGISSIAHSFRRVLLSHPATAAIITTRSAEGPSALRILECILALLRKAGFELGDAVRVQGALVRFLISLVSFEASLLPELGEEERVQKARRTRFELESLPSAEFANLIEAAPFLATPFEPEATFEFALTLLRGGIEAQLARATS